MSAMQDPDDHLLPHVATLGHTDGPTLDTCLEGYRFLGHISAELRDPCLDAQRLGYHVIQVNCSLRVQRLAKWQTLRRIDKQLVARLSRRPNLENNRRSTLERSGSTTVLRKRHHGLQRVAEDTGRGCGRKWADDGDGDEPVGDVAQLNVLCEDGLIQASE